MSCLQETFSTGSSECEQNNTAYHYECSGNIPPKIFMDELWKFMDSFATGTITIKNTQLSMKGGDTLNVKLLQYIKIDENLEIEQSELEGIFEPTSIFWKTKRGIFLVFEDQYIRTIPMSISDITIPIIIKKNNGEIFDSTIYKLEISERIPDTINKLS